MNIKELNENLKKLIEEYGEYSELNWADDYEELNSTEYTTHYLCKVGNEYCIATVEYNQAGDADTCDRSKLFKTKEDCLNFYNTEYKED